MSNERLIESWLTDIYESSSVSAMEWAFSLGNVINKIKSTIGGFRDKVQVKQTTTNNSQTHHFDENAKGTKFQTVLDKFDEMSFDQLVAISLFLLKDIGKSYKNSEILAIGVTGSNNMNALYIVDENGSVSYDSQGTAIATFFSLVLKYNMLQSGSPDKPYTSYTFRMFTNANGEPVKNAEGGFKGGYVFDTKPISDPKAWMASSAPVEIKNHGDGKDGNDATRTISMDAINKIGKTITDNMSGEWTKLEVVFTVQLGNGKTGWDCKGLPASFPQPVIAKMLVELYGEYKKLLPKYQWTKMVLTLQKDGKIDTHYEYK